MKLSQTDIIVASVFIVISLGLTTAFWFMKREPVAPAAPTPVVLTPPALPAGEVAFANALPGGGGGGGGGGAVMGGASGVGGAAPGRGGRAGL